MSTSSTAARTPGKKQPAGTAKAANAANAAKAANGEQTVKVEEVKAAARTRARELFTAAQTDQMLAQYRSLDRDAQAYALNNEELFAVYGYTFEYQLRVGLVARATDDARAATAPLTTGHFPIGSGAAASTGQSRCAEGDARRRAAANVIDCSDALLTVEDEDALTQIQRDYAGESMACPPCGIEFEAITITSNVPELRKKESQFYAFFPAHPNPGPETKWSWSRVEVLMVLVDQKVVVVQPYDDGRTLRQRRLAGGGWKGQRNIGIMILDVYPCVFALPADYNHDNRAQHKREWQAQHAEDAAV